MLALVDKCMLNLVAVAGFFFFLASVVVMISMDVAPETGTLVDMNLSTVNFLVINYQPFSWK